MYERFAEVYDKFQEIDYKEFLDFYEKVFSACGCRPELVLDLACGTGNITCAMAKLGYDMIGIDISTEMLRIAADKAREKNLDILFLNQDMTDFELYGTVDAAVCALDGVNYIDDAGGLRRMFHLVHNYLNPGGVMIFDINSEYKLKYLLGNNSFVYEDDESYCVWNNEYDEKRKEALFDINLFVLDEDGRYSRYDEEQTEHAYAPDELLSIAGEEGLDVFGVYGGTSFAPVSDTSERIFFVIQKPKE